jgi:hypothetical protein
VMTIVHQSGFPVLTVVADDNLWELSAAADCRYVFHLLVCEEPGAPSGRVGRPSLHELYLQSGP